MASLYIIVVLTTNIVISVVGGFFNLLLIIAFARFRHLRTPSNWFNLLSFLSGFLISVFAYPIQGLIDSFIIRDNPTCLIFMVTVPAICICYTSATLCLTVERYITICHPLQATRIITTRRVASCIAVILIFSIMISVVIPLATPLSNKGPITHVHRCRLHVVIPYQAYSNTILGVMLAPVPVMVVIYCRIFIVLRRHLRAIADINVVQRSVINRISVVEVNASSGRERHRRRQEARSVCLLFSLVLSFAICWMPTILFLMYKPFVGYVSPLEWALYHALVYLNFAVNPFIYGLGNKTFRSAVGSMLFGWRRDGQGLESGIHNVTTIG